MENTLINIIDSAVHDGTRVLTVTSEKENAEKMKYIAEDFINGFYIDASVNIINNGIIITFNKNNEK